MRKLFFVLLAFTTISFSYIRLDNADTYYETFNKYNLDINDRFILYYMNADLLSNNQKKIEMNKFLEDKLDVNLGIYRISNIKEIYNLDEIINILEKIDNKNYDKNLSFIIERLIQNGYTDKLKSMYNKRYKNKYIYDRLNNNYSNILKYRIPSEISYVILKDMQYVLIKNTKEGSVKDLEKLLDFTNKYLKYFNIEDKKDLFKVYIALEKNIYLLSELDKKYNIYLKKANKIVEKLMEEKDIKLLNVNYNLINKQFFESRR